MPDLTTISPSLEDYLEVILTLTELDARVRVTDLADKLNVAKSSVNQAVGKLTELGFVNHERYGPLELTSKGREKARKIKQRHRVLEEFFTAVLGVDKRTAARDACLIEHYISPVTMERLLAFLEAQVSLAGESQDETKS